MPGRFVAAYPSVIHNPKPRAVERIGRFHHALLQCCGCRDDLECRTRLIGVIDASISPHPVACILNFLFAHAFHPLWKGKWIIQIKLRHVYHCQNLSCLWMHQNN